MNLVSVVRAVPMGVSASVPGDYQLIAKLVLAAASNRQMGRLFGIIGISGILRKPAFFFVRQLLKREPLD
jgi:hypothetical protein